MTVTIDSNGEVVLQSNATLTTLVFPGDTVNGPGEDTTRWAPTAETLTTISCDPVFFTKIGGKG